MTNPKPPPPSAEAPSSAEDHAPMKVGHGRKLMTGISATHRDVILTKADTETILDLLSPTEGEPDPVMEALERIERLMTERFEALNLRLIAIERQLGARHE